MGFQLHQNKFITSSLQKFETLQKGKVFQGMFRSNHKIKKIKKKSSIHVFFLQLVVTITKLEGISNTIHKS